MINYNEKIGQGVAEIFSLIGKPIIKDENVCHFSTETVNMIVSWLLQIKYDLASYEEVVKQNELKEIFDKKETYALMNLLFGIGTNGKNKNDKI